MCRSTTSTPDLEQVAAALSEFTRVLRDLTEVLAAIADVPDVELKLFTPAEAAELLGKSETWVLEQIQKERIRFTRVGKSPRLTAAHIREIAARGEVRPAVPDAVGHDDLAAAA